MRTDPRQLTRIDEGVWYSSTGIIVMADIFGSDVRITQVHPQPRYGERCRLVTMKHFLKTYRRRDQCTTTTT